MLPRRQAQLMTIFDEYGPLSSLMASRLMQRLHNVG